MPSKTLKTQMVKDAHALVRMTFPDIQDFRRYCLFLNTAIVHVARMRNLKLILQAGSAFWPRVTEETDDGVEPNRFGYQWEASTLTVRRLVSGLLPEMHVWAADPERMEIVDLVSGAFPTQCARLAHLPWKAPKPPEWFWGPAAELPALASYLPSREAIACASLVLDQAIRHARALRS